MDALLKFLSALPLPLLHLLGTLGGWIVFLTSKRYRKYLLENLSGAGYGDRRTRNRAIAEAGKAVLEASAIWLRPQQDVVRWVKQVSGAEMVDEGPRTAPSKRILAIAPDYTKTVAGPQAIEAIGIERIRSVCTHADAWLARLEALA